MCACDICCVGLSRMLEEGGMAHCVVTDSEKITSCLSGCTWSISGSESSLI